MIVEETVSFDLTGLQMPGAPEQPREGQIVLRPLERGFGHTLGNTLRRILLSSLRGAAAWGFRTDGVVHEHQTIRGVVEDVHQIIKNLKSLVLKMEPSADRAVLELHASKAGPVTAANIRQHASVAVINPDHHILQLEEDRELLIQLFVDKGRGFVLAEEHAVPEDQSLPADLIRIDAIYNPVRRANFVVEETRVGQRTDFDRLVLEVETNGSLDARSAVQYAARLAIEHFGILAGQVFAGVGDRPWRGVENGAAAEEPGEVDKPPAPRQSRLTPAMMEVLNSSVVDMELTTRTKNVLITANFETVRDIVARPRVEIANIDKFGPKSLEELEEYLQAHGLGLGLAIEQGDDGALWWREHTGADLGWED
ncbi:MAG: DNA-directed RNA polymerase subunit alpha [Longimicrobiaceae bacterium]